MSSLKLLWGCSLSDLTVKPLISRVYICEEGTGVCFQTTRIFARANRLEHRACERIIELATRLQFNRQMGEAFRTDLEPKVMSEIAASLVALAIHVSVCCLTPVSASSR